MSVRRLEEMLLVAILDNSQQLHNAAQQYAHVNNLTEQDITSACNKVKRFLKWGLTTNILAADMRAIIQVQSVIRMFLVRQRLRKEVEYYKRLAYIDTPDHITIAEKIQFILKS
jgi:hypothetical protein